MTEEKYRRALLRILGDAPLPFTDPWQMCREIAAEAIGCAPGSPPVPEGYKRMYGGQIQPKTKPMPAALTAPFCGKIGDWK